MGLSNADYATWLNENAVAEFESINNLLVKDLQGHLEATSNQDVIKSYLEDVIESDVQDTSLVRFSGGSGSETWDIKDERTSGGIERTTTDNEYVPILVKRSFGA